VSFSDDDKKIISLSLSSLKKENKVSELIDLICEEGKNQQIFAVIIRQTFKTIEK
jgi:hypothetical protein